ncbi:glycosyltransferase family 9 protein [Victivallis sp. Marseille-Q1083]|uniref:glycosyltransferase family 9 protein n=1 Tax=Victivallis sp. Marseille-Q1083 TaxID=2717288 RepID=UPI00158BEB7A|nr:glycosyltransferase family 9 protein [Victivallis sp. Marseille-Q1083]
MRILIIKPSSLGDIFHVFPAIALLRRQYPDAIIDWLVHPSFADALDYCPGGVDRKIFFHRRHLGRLSSFVPTAWRLLGELRRYKYDLIFDFQGLLRSALCGFAARGRQTVGWAAPREPAASRFYRHRIAASHAGHALEKNLDLVRTFCQLDPGAAAACPVPVQPDHRRKMLEKLKRLQIEPADRLIGVVPGARWSSKQFPAELFAQILKAIRAKDGEVKFLMLGSNDDMPAVQAIREHCDDPLLCSLVGCTHIGEMIEAVRCCDLLLSGDTGPIHLAAAMEIPVFALFGSTDPVKTGPYGDIHHVYQAPLDCVKCMRRRCPHQMLPACHQLDAPRIAADMLTVLAEIPPHDSI